MEISTRIRAGAVLTALAICGSLAIGGVAHGATKSDSTKTSDATAWSMESDCASCHTIQPESTDDPNCLIATHAAFSCTDCHSDEKGLAKAHKKAKPEKADKVKKLRKSVIDTELCLTCHGPADKLAETTDDEALLLADREGTAVNPHAVPANEDHAEAVTCAECHSMHAPVDEKATTRDVAQELCISCHHDNVFSCHTCHD